MSEPAANISEPPSPHPRGHWPHRLGHEPTLRVGDVLAALKSEFPSLSPSKLRFLDAQGLVSPMRTASGYRHYSPADVERVRYVLRQQRDAYAPLSVIKERLADLDAGRSYEPISLAAVGEEQSWISADAAARLADAAPETVALLIDEGLISEVEPGRLERASIPLLGACARYLDAGADVRELRALMRVAARESAAASAAAAPLRRRDDAVAHESAVTARLEAAATLFAEACHQSRTSSA